MAMLNPVKFTAQKLILEKDPHFEDPLLEMSRDSKHERGSLAPPLTTKAEPKLFPINRGSVVSVAAGGGLWMEL